ncbi:MAG: hemerythrin domain-containing protein, partial [bacterium]
MKDTLDRLRHDHRELRGTLDVLEEALISGAESAERLAPLCASLSARLRSHIRAEGQVAVRCSRLAGPFGPEVLARLAVEHYPEQQYLRVLGRGLRRKPVEPIQRLRTPATALLHELRRHMDEQEAALFPFIE